MAKAKGIFDVSFDSLRLRGRDGAAEGEMLIVFRDQVNLIEEARLRALILREGVSPTFTLRIGP